MIFKNAFYIFAIVILSGGFGFQLAGVDPTEPRLIGDGSAQSQVIIGAIYIFSTVVLFRAPNGGRSLSRTLPIFILPVLAIFSALWAPAPDLTLRRAIALFGTVAFGLSMACNYNFKPGLRVLLQALTLTMVLSIVWVFVFPNLGVHQANDAVESIHVGKWRGIFAHKNPLGAVSGFTLSMLVLYGDIAFRSSIIRFGAMATTLVCLIFARSGTGFTAAFSTTLIGILVSFIARAPVRLRSGLIAYCFLVCLFFAFFSDYIVDAVLSLLGKDPDLTGRTIYWNYILPFMNDHWLIGYGYFSGFLSIGATIADITKLDFGSTHNGYLDVLVSFGIVGVTAVTVYLSWVLSKSVAMIVQRVDLGSEKSFPFCVVLFSLQLNLVESAMLGGNSLWPLVLAFAAALTVIQRA